MRLNCSAYSHTKFKRSNRDWFEHQTPEAIFEGSNPAGAGLCP